MWRKSTNRKLCSLLVVCLLWPCLGGICSASDKTYSITESELTQLQGNLNKLEQNYKILLQDSNTSSKQLVEALEQLTELKQSLEKCKSELSTTQQSLTKAQSSLTTANELFRQYAREEQTKQAKLRLERDVLAMVALYLVVKK